ncbi:MAG: hypothetical protein KIS62_07445 [Ramlibacter sp.]|nr:hypothetical protein [Ramlibacter sp.]MCW5649560.1 hypothetical protein [Ramlibacter sp.]
MLLQKTEKARSELRPGVRTLGQRERSLLLLADGQRSIHDFRPLFDGEGEQIVLKLVRDGYLSPSRQSPAISEPAPASAPAPLEPPAAAPGNSADPFEGKRSLATTRMFLFDICERMFARRDPARAEAFREALRAARDRDSMLAAAREMIADIEKAAGPERADSISERIAMLLPPEVAA